MGIRALASIGVIIASAVVLKAATTPVQNHASDAVSAYNAESDQYAVWGAWKIYCMGCHVGSHAPGGINLQALDLDDLARNGEVWEKLLPKLRNREMPPAGMARPDEATYQTMLRFIETERDHATQLRPNPGRPTIHRLNRTEYANVIHDLLALDIDVTGLLPADDIGYGFDNIGDVLSVSPLLMERYLAAAAKISRLAVGDTSIPATSQTYTVPSALKQDVRLSETTPIGTRGGAVVRHLFPVDGEYEISVSLQRDLEESVLGMGKTRKLDLRLDDQRLKLFTIAADPKSRAGPEPIGARALSEGAAPGCGSQSACR